VRRESDPVATDGRRDYSIHHMEGMDLLISSGEVVTRLTLALVYGGLIGWEREVQKKPAGLRTHMMVSLGSAAFTLVSFELAAAARERDGMPSDPIRIVEGVTAGIGFLGGGSIIQSRGSVEGITTAAGLWVVGAIGIACGGGHYVLATTTALLAFAILACLGLVERRTGRPPAEEQSKERSAREPGQ
jgi:putative Mg2+ transporter-C (MgtC) family protein